MTWSLVLALLWVVVLVPVGYVLGRTLHRVDDHDAGRAPVEALLAVERPTTRPASLDSPSAPVPGGPDAFSRHA